MDIQSFSDQKGAVFSICKGPQGLPRKWWVL